MPETTNIKRVARKPTKNLYDKLVEWEGCILHTYIDSAGVPTIGVGSTMYKDGSKPKMGQTISLCQAEELLAWEVERKASIVDSLLGNTKVTQNQYEACVSFAFNCGVGAFEKSTLLRRIRLNPNDKIGITEAFMMWTKSKNPKTGKLEVNKGLEARRKKEIALYFKS